MKIISLLPAATEIACALWLEPFLAGISFECDYPKSVTRLPRVVATSLDTRHMPPERIDREVTALMREGKSLYVIDEAMLKRLRPDIILTQNLCQVCAPSGNELSQALAALDYSPRVIFMSPHSLSDIEDNIRELAAATGTQGRAEALIADGRKRREAVERRVAERPRPRVFVMEWVDPVYGAGHWLSEMIALAGGEDALARPGADSVRVSWDDVRKWAPEVLVIAPCGYNREQAQQQMTLLYGLPGWNDIPAVKNKRVHPVDANAYFVRAGPRLTEGLEMLADFFHP